MKLPISVFSASRIGPSRVSRRRLETTIQLVVTAARNIPLLKESAERNRRGLNSEILIRLESAFTAPVVDVLAHARELKAFTDVQPMTDHGLV